MARIRTIKPEFFRHEALFETEKEYQLPLRIAFSGLFTCCDREGRFRWRPRQLKLDILPYDEVDFSRVLDVLATRGFIVKYEVNNEIYGCIPSWNKHQQINHKEAASQLPSPGNGHVYSSTKSLTKIQDAPNQDQVLDNQETREPHASITHNELTLEPPRNSCGEKEMEKEVEMEKEGKGNGSGNISDKSKTKDDVDFIFNHWKQVMGHPKAVLDKHRREFISAALTLGYAVEELCEAISGCSRTPHNMGANEHGERYDGLHIIFKDANQIDRFRRNFECPPRPQNCSDKRVNDNVNAAKTWLECNINIQGEQANGQN